jgi:three-Cys-motif partner protein
MANDNTYDEIGLWSEVKLDIIREYASAYSIIMDKQPHIKRHVYVDACAGYGVHLSKTTGSFVLGSPANALLVEPPFSEFHFIDLNPSRVDSLQQIADGYFNVTVHQGDCNQLLLQNVFPRCQYEDYSRGLCLIDPYKLNIDWNVLKTAGEMGSIEIFFNFMIMDANRNVLWHRPDQVPQEQVDRMNFFWGDDSWRNAAYNKKQRSLFDDERIAKKTSNETIATAFQERLRDVAGFKFVPKPLPMTNSNGAVVYYLYFASPNKTGAKIVTDIFAKYQGRM